MTPEKRVNAGGFYEHYQSLITDRFVGREEALAQVAEILQYPRRGKGMPVVVITGQSGSGKSWLLARISQKLSDEMLPFIPIDLRTTVQETLPGGFVHIANETTKRVSIKTPRLNKVLDIYLKRFMGITTDPVEDSGGFFRGIIRSLRGEPDEDAIEATELSRIYGENWDEILPGRPLYEHLKAMAIALAEDIDSGLERTKYPFITLLFDSWEDYANRFASHWFRLFDTANRLFVIIATCHPPENREFINITLGDFDDTEASTVLERRGIGSGQACARIIGNTGNNPLAISLAASLADTLTRKGDIIRSNSFDIGEDSTAVEEYSKNTWKGLRESEQYALAACIRGDGLPIGMFAELFAQRADLLPSLIVVSGFVPFDPVLSGTSPVRLHRLLKPIFEKLSMDVTLPTEADLAERTKRLMGRDDHPAWETAHTKLDMRIEPEEAFNAAIEQVIGLVMFGDFDQAESLWRSARPVSNKRGLAAVHCVIGNRLIADTFSSDERVEYFGSFESDDTIYDGAYRIEYARAVADNGDNETALKELQDCVSALSGAITETSGGEPALWYLRGRALHLAAELINRAGVPKEAISTGEKALVSFDRAINSGLDPAGLISIDSARTTVLMAEAESSFGDLKGALKRLDKARESIFRAIEKRSVSLPDINLLAAEILYYRGKIHKLAGNWTESEEFFNSALAELKNINNSFVQPSAEGALFAGKIYLALAELIEKTGSEETAIEVIGRAQDAFARYEELIGGNDPAGWIGRGKALLIKSNLLSMDDTEEAISSAREARRYFEKAWDNESSLDAAACEIDALILEGDLLAEDDKPFDELFDKAEKTLIAKLDTPASRVQFLKRWVKLAKSRGRAAYLNSDHDTATRYFADAIEGYEDLHNIAPEQLSIADLAEIQLASAIALRAGGEPYNAFQSLIRAEEAFEIAADKSTNEGRRKVLRASIGVYNDLESTGHDEEAFEAALFVLELIAQIGGQEVMEIGHELLVFWEAQGLSLADSRRLEQVAAPLREYWGET